MSAQAAMWLAQGAVGVAVMTGITIILLGVMGALPWQNRRGKR
jgi:hypothetical protein